MLRAKVIYRDVEILYNVSLTMEFPVEVYEPAPPPMGVIVTSFRTLADACNYIDNVKKANHEKE